MTERVDELIERVMKAFPSVSALAQSRYYEEVHQELAPLARELERQLDELLSAAKNLRDVKGRFHSEQAMEKLLDVIAKVEVQP